MKLGIGRYLYELPKVTAAFDNGKWTKGAPTLPDWAIPKKNCQECSKEIVSIIHGEKQISVAQLIANSTRKYDGLELCADCQRKRSEGSTVAAKVG